MTGLCVFQIWYCPVHGTLRIPPVYPLPFPENGSRKFVSSSYLSQTLYDFAYIWKAGALWASWVTNAENWRNGRPQVAMQRYLPPFLVIIIF